MTSTDPEASMPCSVRAEPIALVPWPQAARRKDLGDYDAGLVTAALTRPLRDHDIVDIDPRLLQATQAFVLRPGVEHYLGPTYRLTGLTHADGGKLG
jgi:hypothetical protein